MVEYKASLKLRIPKSDNIMGLSIDRYNVISCDYELYRHTNPYGEVSSSLRGGIIHLEISDIPDDGLMAWVFDHAKRYNGEITVFDTDEETLEQLYFEEARCVDFKFCYNYDNKQLASVKLSLVANAIQIGDVEFNNINK